MTEKSKETIEWIKWLIQKYDAKNKDDNWGLMHSKLAYELLDKIAEVEVYATRGGYIKDCQGIICKDGDKVLYKLNTDSKPELAKLYWNAEGDFLVQSFREGENPYYLWEIAEWQKAVDYKESV